MEKTFQESNINKKSIWIVIGIVSAIITGFAIVRVDTVILLILIASIGMVMGILFRPAFGAALILALAPLEGLIGFGTSFTGVKLVSLICFALVAIKIAVKRSSIEIDATSKIIAVFLLWSALSIIWSPVPNDSLIKWISFVLQSLMYVLIIYLVRSRDELNLALWGSLIGGLILSYIYIDSIVIRDFSRRALEGSFSGSRQGVNLSAKMIGINFFIAVILYNINKRFIVRLFLFLSLTIITIALIVLMSRGTWYGILIGLLILIVISIKKNKLSVKQILISSILILSVFVILSNYLLDSDRGMTKLTERFTSSYTFEDAGANRFYIWGVGLEMFKESPMLGHGYGTFPYVFSHYLEGSKYSGDLDAFEHRGAHNAFINILTTTGLIGLLLFVSILYTGARNVWNSVKKGEVNAVVIAIAMGLWAFLVISCMVDTSDSRKYFWYALSLITLMVRYYGHNSNRWDNKSR